MRTFIYSATLPADGLTRSWKTELRAAVDAAGAKELEISGTEVSFDLDAASEAEAMTNGLEIVRMVAADPIQHAVTLRIRQN